ncbi:MAG: hypothetical protein KatS3mg102_2726 [Planctomycetota bacterium]|nr:MAG: hypothetical protein KatS3mg102_2726 [Planctomycetota bacterium]
MIGDRAVAYWPPRRGRRARGHPAAGWLEPLAFAGTAAHREAEGQPCTAC